MTDWLIALALGAAAPAAVETPATAPALPAPARQDDKKVSSRMIGDDQLRETRGGASVIVTNQTLLALTSGNTLGNYTAGNVALADNALSNFAGVGNFLINTGAQNSLQTGMTLVINVNP